MKKKISIVGAGKAGCITAMQYHLMGKDLFDKITIYHDPSSPIERVGQGTILSISFLINNFFYLDFLDNNLIKSTRKEGIMYENWGKKNEKIFHPFSQSMNAIHYVPNLLSKAILESGVFEVIEKNITDPEKEIDCDYIIDCRGKDNRDKNLYDSLTNPLNSVILAREEKVYPNHFYTRTVATPNGWTFVIPNTDSTSYGYLYNDQITSREDAEKDFIERFNIVPDGFLKFDNYLAKSCFVGDRTILNGNRLSFLEPLEASSTGFYSSVAMFARDYIMGDIDREICDKNIKNEMKRIENFVLWHYQFGSKFDTPFWDYAKSLPFNPDPLFNHTLDHGMRNSYSDLVMNVVRYREPRIYSQWNSTSFKCWAEGVM